MGRVRGPLLVMATVLVAGAVGFFFLRDDSPRKRTVDLFLDMVRLPSGKLASIAIDDGRVVEVGYTPRFRQEFDAVQTLDGQGGVLLGGVHDHHTHLFSGGKSLEELQLGEPDTLEALEEAVRAWSEAHAGDPWIIGRGWHYSLFPDGLPTRALLDRWVPEKPVMLESFDGHAQWTNSAALAKAGITPNTPNPPEGTIVRDGSGAATGVFLEAAQKLVEGAVPALTREQQREILARAARYVASLGISTVDDMVYSDATERIELLRALHDAGELPIRVRVFPVVPADVEDETLDAIKRLKLSLADHPRLSVPGIKLFVDGVIESKTAYLKAPYATGGGTGAPRLSGEQLGSILARAAERELAVVMHTIGDAAASMALDAVEALGKARPPLLRLEHIELLSPEDRTRFAALGVEASMQPLHADPGGPNPEEGVWSENLGVARLPLTFPWRDLLDAGAFLRFGSDWPVVSANPLPGIAVALSRQDRMGQPEGGWIPEQRIRLEEALEAYNATPDLSPGSPVDLIVLDPAVALHSPRNLWRSTAIAAVRWRLLGRAVQRF